MLGMQVHAPCYLPLTAPAIAALDRLDGALLMEPADPVPQPSEPPAVGLHEARGTVGRARAP